MINIANLLRNAKKGTILWSPLFGPVKFLSVDSADSTIIVETERETQEWFSACGIYKVMKSHLLYPDSECLLFPGKDYRTWQGWTPCVEPNFKVGDWIVQNDNGTVSQITKVINDTDEYGEYRAYEHTNGYFAACFENEYHLWTIADAKDGDILSAKIDGDDYILLFKQIKDGWVETYGHYYITIDRFCTPTQLFCRDFQGTLHPATQEQYKTLFKKMREAGYQWDADKKELKKIQHYDIANFEPLDPVLVRQNDSCTWGVSFFGRYSEMFICCSNVCFEQCIPFNGETKHLLGTTDMPSEEFINW